MKKGKNLEKFKSFMILLIILSAFVMGFYIFSNLYSYKSRDSHSVILDKKLFKQEVSNSEQDYFAVSKIVKFTLPYSITDYDLLDINTIAFMGLNLKDTSLTVKTGIYDMTRNLLTQEVDQQSWVNKSTISVSPDGKMLLSSYYSKVDGLNNAYVYDFLTKRKLWAMNGVSAAGWLPDNSGVIGVDGYLFFQDIKTGKRENLLDLSGYVDKVAKASLRLIMLKDAQNVCLTYSKQDGSTGTLIVDVKTGKRSEINTKAYFFQTVPSYDKNMVVTGGVDDRFGLYSYDLTNNSLKELATLPNQKLAICISQDGKKVAYSVIRSDGVNEIHAALVNDDTVTNDEVIYRSPEIIDKLMWTKDSRMLYCSQRNIDSTTIYRILFKNI